ncbi:MAG: serine protease [Anaerolineae bacterium]|nr:MAG: serine protease [Anaerolineae bacterium]
MAIFHPRLINSIVALGETKEGEFKFTATGFIFGNITHDTKSKGRFNMSMHLVTNHHVIEGLDSIALRVDDRSGTSTRIYELPMYTAEGYRLFESDPELDLAVVSIGNLEPWNNKELGPTHIFSSEAFVSLSQYRDFGVAEGERIFAMGYPMGLVGYDQNLPLVRMGIISRIRDFLDGKSKSIIIDSQIYPGNSGGPVFLDQKPFAENDLAPHIKPGTQLTYLIGVVSGYIPYKETAVSIQSGKPRIEFQENSGLGIIVPAPYIVELINRHLEYRLSLGAKIVTQPFPDS